MAAMDRRRFLQSSVLASGAALTSRMVWAADVPSVALRLTLDPSRVGNPIPQDFTGLSYESAQLADPTFFSPANTELIGLIRRLGASGVLRIGGNTSEYCYWTPQASSQTLAQPLAVGPDTGRKAPPPRKITPQAVDNLRGFVDAIGWQLIYGLNMGTENAETAAAEADYVWRTMGDKLVAFQLCNEPDLFARNGLRTAGYDYAQFAKEWQHFFAVIRSKVPQAPFAGPDTAFNNEWLVPFAKQFANDIVFLSQHYYAEGPPTDPSMTIDRLLRPNPKLVAEFEGMAETKADTHLPFRLTETNSCYSGGKQGVSDTFASALWGADLMYQLAAAGGIGINFHGGGYGWYTPIAGTVQDGFLARPIYYGMLLFAEAGAGHLVEANLADHDRAPLVTAYGLIEDAPGGAVRAIVFNKHEDRRIHLAIAGAPASTRAQVLRLLAPRLDDTTDETLGSNPVGASGAWQGAHEETLPTRDGTATIDMPPESAALVTFQS